MKVRRVLLIVVAAAVAAVLITFAVALDSSAQTWAVRRFLARRPELHLQVGRVSAGIHHVTVTGLKYQGDGATLAVPRIDAQFPVLAAIFWHRVAVDNLTADGWTVDLPATSGTAKENAAILNVASSMNHGIGSDGEKPSGPATGFSGIFQHLELPFDLTVRQVETSGNITFRGSGTDLAVALGGGNLGAARTGTFRLSVRAAVRGKSVQSVSATGMVTVLMNTPRSFAHLAFDLDATAARTSGPPVTLRMELKAERSVGEERYGLTVSGNERPLMVLQATYPTAARQITGHWKLDLNDNDLAPFALGHPLPSFAAVGEGSLESDARFSAVHASGRLDAAVDRLDVFEPQLSAIGSVKLTVDMDLGLATHEITVSKMGVAIRAERPVATVDSLQPFAFNPATGEVHGSNPTQDLVGIVLRGVPLAWVKPFAPQWAATGSDLRGELVASSRGGGFTFRSKTPLQVSGLSIRRDGQLLLQDLNVSLNVAGDYTKNGWQAELTGATAKVGHSTMLLLDAKAGRLSGIGQPMKAAGLLTVNLPSLLAEPIAAGALRVASGDATVEFLASFASDHSRQIQARVATNGLAADPKISTEPMPAISANIRADISADQQITLSIPILLERKGRKSDLSIVGRYVPAARALNAQMTSANLVVQDASVLANLLPGQSANRESPADEPPWSGLSGSLALQLQKVVYSGTLELTNVTGTLHVAADGVHFENLRAGVGDGKALGTGLLTMRPGLVPSYRLKADLALSDFNPGPWFRTANPHQPPPLEGRCTLTTSMGAEAESLPAMPATASGTFELTSKSGTFRGLSVNVGNLVENSSKLKAWLASAGDAITSIARRKDYEEIPSRSQAASELAKVFSAIPYDQLGVIGVRDEGLNTTIREFTLISPEIRIKGTGRVKHTPGRPVRDDTVEMEYQLRARGRPAELMKILGVLDGKSDDLGYAACTIPVKVNGTLGRFDTTELGNQLIALAVEKSGLSLTDKAFDWINRLRGKL